MNSLLMDLIDDDVTIVAYRVCYICLRKKEKIDDSIWDTLSFALNVGLKQAFETRKVDVNRCQFEYVELITSDGEVIYVYDDEQGYEKFSNLDICENLGIFNINRESMLISSSSAFVSSIANIAEIKKRYDIRYESNDKGEVTSVWKIRKKSYYLRIYPVEELIDEIKNTLYGLKDGMLSYSEGALGIEGVVDETQKYTVNKAEQLIENVCNSKDIFDENNIDSWIDYLKEVHNSIRHSEKLVDDLGIGLVKVRNEYKTVIEILEKIKKGESSSGYQNQEET